MDIYYLDSGNSRVKICPAAGSGLGPVSVVGSLAELESYLPQRPLQLRYVDVARRMNQWQAPAHVQLAPLSALQAQMSLGDYPADQLGADRLAAALGARHLVPGKELLIIDAGTCITFERVSAQGTFLGGNISPGLRMRYKAMATFTASLPEVSPPDRWTAQGQSTEEALKNGGLFGFIHEVKAAIDYFCGQYPESEVMLTGGDAELVLHHLPEFSLRWEPDLVLLGLAAAKD